MSPPVQTEFAFTGQAFNMLISFRVPEAAAAVLPRRFTKLLADGSSEVGHAQKATSPQQAMIASRQKYFFLHIPKTAGTSLVEVFRRALGSTNVHQREFEFVQPPSLEEADRFQMIGGHYTIASAMPIFKSRKTVVFLRDPVDRFVSAYHFFKEYPDPTEAELDPDVAKAKTLPLLDFARSYIGRQISAFTNWQTWMLSGYPGLPEPVECLLEGAKTNLEKCAFVGLSERFQESVDMLCFDFGWPIIEEKPFVNRTKNRPRLAEIDESFRDLIRELNPLDVELHKFAQTLFERKKHDLWRRACTGGSVSTPTLPVPPVVTADEAESAVVASPEPDQISTQPREFGSKEIQIDRVSIFSNQGESELIYSGDPATIQIHIQSSIDLDDLTVGIRITDDMGTVVYGTNSTLLQKSLRVCAGRAYVATYHIKPLLPPGRYRLTTAVHRSDENSECCFHWLENCRSFRIVPVHTFEGSTNLAAEFSFEEAEVGEALLSCA